MEGEKKIRIARAVKQTCQRYGVKELKEHKKKNFKENEKLWWSEDLHSNTKIVIGDRLEVEDEALKLVIVESQDTKVEKGIQRAYKKCYHDIQKSANTLEILECTTTSIIRIGKISRTGKVVKIQETKATEELWQQM